MGVAFHSYGLGVALAGNRPRGEDLRNWSDLDRLLT